MPELPDAVLVVGKFLRAQPELAAVAARIYTELPGDKTFPFVLVRSPLSRPVATRPLWADRATVDVLVYGSTHGEMATLARTVQRLMCTALPGDHADGAVASIEAVSYSEGFDTELPPYADGRPMRRTALSFQVVTHPVPTVASAQPA